MNHGLFRKLSQLMLVLSAVSLTQAIRCYGEEAFEPYDVYVDQDEVTARCGPGGDYYRTDPLRHGQRLEVYLETADGWLGIRPPDNSFCWVPADTVQLDRGGKSGRVTESGTLAWIGTHLGKARKYMWQVQLSKDEEVVVIGRAEREGPDGPQLWYRIAPPAGEFRWVHRDQVVDSPELLLRDKPRPGEQLASATPTPIDDGIEPFAQSPPRRNSESPGLLATAKSILLNGADDYGTNPPKAQLDRVSLVPVDTEGAIPLADNPPSYAQSQALAAQAPIAPLVYESVEFPPPVQIGYVQGDGNQDFGYNNPIGSGVASTPVARPQQAPIMSVASEPMVRPIGATTEESRETGGTSPSGVQQASDANWIRGASRTQRPQGTTTAAIPLSAAPPVAANQAEGAVPAAAAFTGSGQNRWPTPLRNATVDSIQLELSRRMAATARAVEVESLRLAAYQLANSQLNDPERQRAQLLVGRIEQYQSVARRRDGETAQPVTSLAPSASLTAAASPAANLSPPGQIVLSGGTLGINDASGYLVQVYSARPDSPPFALTDATGRTTHYLSPTPGVNLRRYLNQHVSVGGQAGYDTGLDTPHLIVTAAVRSPLGN